MPTGSPKPLEPVLSSFWKENQMQCLFWTYLQTIGFQTSLYKFKNKIFKYFLSPKMEKPDCAILGDNN